MEVGSVSSSVNAALAASVQSQARVRQPEQDQQAQQTQQSQPSQQTRQTQQTQQAQSSQPVVQSDAADRARAETERSRPTVNANGQTVGTLVNTTA